MPIVLILALLIIIAQNHYTVDIIVALYTVPLLYFFIWHIFPDPKIIPSIQQQQDEFLQDPESNDTIELQIVDST